MKSLVAVVSLVGTVALRANAESPAGTVAALQGVVEVQSGKTWRSLATGDELSVGAHLRSGPNGRAKIVLRDDSVIDLGISSDLTLESLDRQVGKRPAVVKLNKGRVHAWVGESYRDSKGRFEIETPTAIAGARGAEFIVVYSPETDLTEVVGIAEHVEVLGNLAVLSGAAEIGPSEYTQVQKGRFPTAVQKIDELRARSFNEGLDLRGTGRRDGLNVEHPLVAGQLTSKDDVPSVAVATQEPLPDAGARPNQASAFTRSADVYTNRQPLRQYQFNPPGRGVTQGGTGGVHVDF